MSQPRSLLSLRNSLDTLKPPSDPFDPAGAWETRYGVWIKLPDERNFKPHRAGALGIRREMGAGGATLSLVQTTQQNDKTDYVIRARIEVDGNPLATPRRWEWSSAIHTPQGEVVDLTSSTGSGELAGDKLILRTNGHERVLAVTGPVTANWCLFDGLQRMAFDAKELPSFSMLEELSLLKGRQQLGIGETAEVTLPSGTVRMRSITQTGPGLLPYDYWLDDQHRLLLAIGGLRAFIHDPTVTLPEEHA